MSKVKFSFLVLAIILLVFGFLFWWFQIRPGNIKRNCYKEAFRKNELNFEWAEGKNWTYLAAFANGPHGWVYPDYQIARATIYDAANLMKKDQYDEKAIIVQTIEKVTEKRNEVFKRCLAREGFSSSL